MVGITVRSTPVAETTRTSRPDDDVVVDGMPTSSPAATRAAGEVAVLGRGLGVSRGVVVHQDDGARGLPHRGAEDLAGWTRLLVSVPCRRRGPRAGRGPWRPGGPAGTARPGGRAAGRGRRRRRRRRSEGHPPLQTTVVGAATELQRAGQSPGGARREAVAAELALAAGEEPGDAVAGDELAGLPAARECDEEVLDEEFVGAGARRLGADGGEGHGGSPGIVDGQVSVTPDSPAPTGPHGEPAGAAGVRPREWAPCRQARAQERVR